VPELPETTTIARDVAALAAGRRVVRAAVSGPDVTNVAPEEFSRRLTGLSLRETGRRGKAILLDFGSVVGVTHLVISGRVLRLEGWREPDHMHSAVLEFEGGPVLAFTRLWLGYFELYAPEEVEGHRLISRLGPDPFSGEFSVEYLTEAFAGRQAGVKGLLLDQTLVAGIGNIYVDEILFAAGVHPARKASTLTPEEVAAVHAATRRILRRAIELRGTTFDSYHDAFGEQGRYQEELRVFSRPGEPCPACGAEIAKIKVAGRGTHLCPKCQPLEPAQRI
jgi:formamidopyrimidine-DNA glycosylase